MRRGGRNIYVSAYFRGRSRSHEAAPDGKTAEYQETGTVSARQRRDQRKRRRTDHDAAEGDETGRAGDGPHLVRRRVARDFGELHAVPSDCRRAEQAAQREDRRYRPIPAECRRRPCARTRDETDQPEQPARRDAEIGDRAPKNPPADPADIGDRQRETRGHQRKTERLRQVDDEKAHQADLQRRVDECDADELGQHGSPQDESQRRDDARERRPRRRPSLRVQHPARRSVPPAR